MTNPSPERRPVDVRLFLLGVGSWFGSFGLHGVLFSTLLVVELQETELRVGAAQSAIMIPAVVLMLLGGAAADHANRRRLLLVLHITASALALALAGALLAGWLSYPLLIAYAVAMGAIQAFVNPTRDALLSDVVTQDLGKPVAMMNLTQWGSQATGSLIASASRWFGTAPFFALQAGVLLVGALGYSRMAPFASPERPSLSLRELTDGIREVVRTPDLRTTWILVCAVGVVFIGPFMVVFPLMVRDVYGRGAAEIAFVSTAFPLGTISGSLLVMGSGGLHDLMRAQLFGLTVGSSILLVLSAGLPFWGLLLGIYAWGAAGSVFMIAGRTLFQQQASEANRGRVLASYTMGFMGAAGLIGAPLSAALTSFLGPERALTVLGLAMLALVAFVALRRRRAN